MLKAMSKFKRWYALIVLLLMVGTFAYLRVTALMQAPSNNEIPLSHTIIRQIEALRAENPDFYANAKDGDFENVYQDRIEIVDERGQVIASRPRE